MSCGQDLAGQGEVPHSRLPRVSHFSLFLGQAGFGVSPDLGRPLRAWKGRGEVQPAPPGGDRSPRPAPPGTPPPPSDLEVVAVPACFPGCAAPVSCFRGFALLAWLSPSPQSAGLSSAPGSLGAPSSSRLRAALPGGAGRGRAGAADSPQSRAERRAKAQPGTPRHVTARAGATREAGPVRGPGVGRDVAPAREGPPSTGHVTEMQASPSASPLAGTLRPGIGPPVGTTLE